MDWFLYDRDLRRERVKAYCLKIKWLLTDFNFIHGVRFRQKKYIN